MSAFTAPGAAKTQASLNRRDEGPVCFGMNRLLALLLATLSFTALADHRQGNRGRHDDRREGRRSRMDLFATHQACLTAFPGGRAERCVQLASTVTFDPRATISACAAALYYETDRLRCVEQAFSAGVELSRTVTACDQAMYYDSDVMSCLALAVTARVELADTVRACDAAMYYDSDAQRCISSALSTGPRRKVPTPFSPSGVEGRAPVAPSTSLGVNGERSVTNFRVAVLSLGSRGSEVVQFCDRSRPYDSQALECINAFRG
jgi:hypothetical protein